MLDDTLSSTERANQRIYRYAPLWFQWYRAAPLSMTREVVFTDAKSGVYPTQGKVIRVKPGSGCKVPFVYTGHPATSMLIPLRLVWDVLNKDGSSVGSAPPTDFLMIYPYVNNKKDDTVSYEGSASHYPLIRFECEFNRVETPSHVEVIPAANAPKDGEEWEKQQKLTVFPSVEQDADVFLGSLHSEVKAPVMPRHVLLEGKLRAGDRWEVLGMIELPFSYRLPYDMHRLTYKRKIKFVRFTVMGIYMGMDGYPNLKYSHIYFPKMDFFTMPEQD